MHIRKLATFVLCALLGFNIAPALGYSRVKDLVEVEGIRDNMLVGYGLVVGLNGSGDSLKNAPFTQQSLQTMLERMGVNTRGETMQTKNIAAVMVTANLPAFAAQGTRIDVSVSALGDAKSLQGGTLLVTHAVRRRRADLCARPGPGRDRRLLGVGRSAQPASRAACRRRDASPTARSSSARSASRSPARQACACRCTIPI